MHTEDSTPEILHFSVPAQAAGTRLDAYVATLLAPDGVSRGKVQDLMRDGCVLVDGEAWLKSKRKLAGGETLEIRLELPGTDLVPEAGELCVLYEDGLVAVIDKPAGLTVHPAPGLDSGTLAHRIVHRWPQARDMEGSRPGIVHRIDKDTSGLLLVALDEGMRLALSEDFALRRVDKEYLAMVHGVPVPPVGEWGFIEDPIGRHPRQKTKMAVTAKGGREAKSAWKLLWTAPGGRVSLVRVKIFTGRTHQIRVHMAHIGHPLVGDVVYGSREHADMLRDMGLDRTLVPRQMLHAWRLGFTHPQSGQVHEFFCEPPEDFRALAVALAHTVHRVGIVGMPGCGKTALAEFLAEAGVPLFSADQCVAELYAQDADGWLMLRRRFGSELAPENGPVDKAALFAAMRSSENTRREILSVVHPLVRHRMEQFWQAHVHAPLAAAEVPLLLEGGWKDEGLVDTVLGVNCPEAVRREHLLTQRNWDRETVATLESWQWPERDKLARCDLVADNTGSLDDLRIEARRVLDLLAARAADQTSRAKAALTALWAAPEADAP